jgi:hypothetical protein
LVADLAEVQPGIEVGLDEPLGARILQQAFYLLSQTPGFGEAAILGCGEEDVVRWSGPERVGRRAARS